MCIGGIGIYIALFGIASQRYENKVDLIEYQHTAILTTVAAGAPFVGAKLQILENSTCPAKPEILNPISVLQSMFWFECSYLEFDGLLQKTVEEWKTKLFNANLSDQKLC